MTEAVAGSLVVVALWFALLRRSGWLAPVVLSATVLGAATLVRPQLVVLAPVFGWLAWSHCRRQGPLRDARGLCLSTVAAPALASAIALGLCLPWTLRNCQRMERCVFVSANAGWNLLIGTSELGRGGWAPLDQVGVPGPCKLVFHEAEKDACFLHGALARIREAPVRWAALAPAKLGVTFDYSGAAAYYLHASNAEVFDSDAKLGLGVLETAWQRALLLVALLAAARAPGPVRRLRCGVALAAAVSLLFRSAWIGYLGFVVVTALLGRRAARAPELVGAAVTVVTTAAVHAVFFGAGRYSLVTSAVLAATAGAAARPARSEAEPVSHLRLKVGSEDQAGA
jgi:hypothetical protein